MTLTLGELAMNPEAAAPPMIDPTLDGFLSVVDRLQGVIEYETDSLSRHVAVDLADLNRRKRQGMLELSRVMRAFADRTPPDQVRDRLAGLTDALDRNRAVLDVQLGAVREIAEIVSRVIKDAEWDGTYSMRTSRP